MKQEQKKLNMLGLAQRAGKLISGDERTEAAIKAGQAQLVILASDASEATQTRYQQWSENYQVPIDTAFSREQISHAIGRSRSICAILDSGMTNRYLSYSTRNEAAYDND